MEFRYEIVWHPDIPLLLGYIFNNVGVTVDVLTNEDWEIILTGKWAAHIDEEMGVETYLKSQKRIEDTDYLKFHTASMDVEPITPASTTQSKGQHYDVT